MKFFTAALLVVGAGLAAQGTAEAQFQRTVLIEEFTSVSCPNCPVATANLNQIKNEFGSKVVIVRYHMDFPQRGDPMNLADPLDNKARQTTYGVTAIPASRVDGASSDPKSLTSSRSDVNAELSADSPIQISVVQTPIGQDSASVAVTITTKDVALSSAHLHLALAENHIQDSASLKAPSSQGEVEFFDVMRKLMPGADGQAVSIPANQTRTFTFGYTNYRWYASRLVAVAFVQDDFNNQILQAAQSGTLSSGIQDITASTSGYMLEQSAPNPASGDVSIGYTIAAPQQVSLTLYDAAGTLVKNEALGMQESGRHMVHISTEGLASGAYTYTISAGSFQATRQMVLAK